MFTFIRNFITQILWIWNYTYTASITIFTYGGEMWIRSQKLVIIQTCFSFRRVPDLTSVN